MHRITLPDGAYRQSAFLRWARTVAYLLMSASGGLLLYSDILTTAYGQWSEVMAGFIVLGGLLSALGSMTLRWAGEFVGLPLLGSSFVVLGILMWRGDHESSPYIAAANMCLLVSVGVVMLARWRVVLAVYHVATALGKEV